MKIRTGFVSNSSSSSFICDVCGRDYSGYDASLEDADMYQCKNGHVLCDECVVEEVDIEAADFDRSYIDEKYCPICNFLQHSDSDIKKYFKKEYGIKEEDVFEKIHVQNKRRRKLYDSEYIVYVCVEKNLNVDDVVASIKEKFKTYSAFLTYINGR